MMRRINSSTPSSWTLAGFTDIPPSLPSETGARRHSWLVFVHSLPDSDVNGGKLQRAASCVAGLTSPWTLVRKTTAFLSKAGDDVGEHRSMKLSYLYDNDVQTKVQLSSTVWADEDVSCFSNNAATSKICGYMLRKISTASTASIPSLFSSAACTPFGDTAIADPNGATGCVLARCWQSPIARASAKSLLRSFGSNGSGALTVSGKRSHEEVTAGGGNAEVTEFPSPRCRLRRVRKVFQDLDRLDEH
jgi:hypothetical protein